MDISLRADSAKEHHHGEGKSDTGLLGRFASSGYKSITTWT
jgi:hypothetical protein